MAHLPRRSPELPLKSVFILLLPLLLAPWPCGAQEARNGGDGATAAIDAGLLLTQVEGDVVWMSGGIARVRVAPGLHVGGGGWLMLTSVPVQDTPGRPETELDFGYGGAVVSASIRLPRSSLDLVARALLGAGNADLRTRATGILLASDNFGVAEPALLLHVPLASRISAVVGGSYRFVLGVEDLLEVRASDLSAPSLALGVTLGPF